MSNATNDNIRTLTTHGKEVKVLSKPRYVPGGYLVTVCWVTDDPSITLRDGRIHPMARAGYKFEVPVCNLS